ncbi:hypothetical protein BD410DRAFT_788334 [Rickenella mellea]|uniref:Uncharacterized protein n=1 Tax=Rickenella mellea TaxID=50990 RepID=A0A4Y7Q5U6_9AGAM|nr:hypothetical protein BD410DRAFT_788334 [Rickenella mellea]
MTPLSFPFGILGLDPTLTRPLTMSECCEYFTRPASEYSFRCELCPFGPPNAIPGLLAEPSGINQLLLSSTCEHLHSHRHHWHPLLSGNLTKRTRTRLDGARCDFCVDWNWRIKWEHHAGRPN